MTPPTTHTTGDPDYAIEVAGLTKYYGAKTGKPALDDVTLNIPRGMMFGLLGPNGAGKSTLINILAGLVVKSAGTARIWGHDIVTDERQAKASIGIVPQELNIDPFFTPKELLEVQAGLYGVPRRERRTAAILETVGLTDMKDAYARTLSGGMSRRLLIGKAMVHDPPVLVLDEPTAGVDVALRQQLWENVQSLNRRGVTILLTTHYLEEAQEFCDRIAIIDQGRLVANEETGALLGRLDSKTLRFQLRETVRDMPAALQKFNPVICGDAPGNGGDGGHGGETGQNGSALKVSYQPSVTSAGEIIAAVAEAGLSIIDLSSEETDLEDIFLQLTRRDERADGN